jgi:hypothetical protein
MCHAMLVMFSLFANIIKSFLSWRERRLEEEALRYATKALKLSSLAMLFIAVGCCDEFVAPDVSPPTVSVRVANFHDGFDAIAVESLEPGGFTFVNKTLIRNVVLEDDGVLILRGSGVTYEIPTPVLFDNDVIVIRETNSGSRVTIDVVNSSNKDEACAMYAGFEQAELYSKLCPNIRPTEGE